MRSSIYSCCIWFLIGSCLVFIASGTIGCTAASRVTVIHGKKAPMTGIASYYGPGGLHGRRTASGERYNMYGLTAAHRTLPFGTKVRVINLKTGKKVVVRINDRGPFVKGRIIDLSLGAARAIGIDRSGSGRVRLEIVN